MQANMMSDAIQLLVYGMGTVFVFLFLLVLATRAMSSLVMRFSPVVEPSSAVPTPVSHAVNPEVVQAIALAVQEYRKDHR